MDGVRRKMKNDVDFILFKNLWRNLKAYFCSYYLNDIMSAQEIVSDSEALCRSDDPQHPSNLIPELCRLFYQLGWVTGTGGGISIRNG